jgi:hypothetical protein
MIGLKPDPPLISRPSFQARVLHLVLRLPQLPDGSERAARHLGGLRAGHQVQVTPTKATTKSRGRFFKQNPVPELFKFGLGWSVWLLHIYILRLLPLIVRSGLASSGTEFCVKDRARLNLRTKYIFMYNSNLNTGFYRFSVPFDPYSL